MSAARACSHWHSRPHFVVTQTRLDRVRFPALEARRPGPADRPTSANGNRENARAPLSRAASPLSVPPDSARPLFRRSVVVPLSTRSRSPSSRRVVGAYRSRVHQRGGCARSMYLHAPDLRRRVTHGAIEANPVLPFSVSFARGFLPSRFAVLPARSGHGASVVARERRRGAAARNRSEPLGIAPSRRASTGLRVSERPNGRRPPPLIRPSRISCSRLRGESAPSRERAPDGRRRRPEISWAYGATRTLRYTAVISMYRFRTVSG